MKKIFKYEDEGLYRNSDGSTIAVHYTGDGLPIVVYNMNNNKIIMNDEGDYFVFCEEMSKSGVTIRLVLTISKEEAVLETIIFM